MSQSGRQVARSLLSAAVAISRCWAQPVQAVRCLSSKPGRHPWYTDVQFEQQQQHRSEMEKAVLKKRAPDLRKERRIAMLSGMLRNGAQEVLMSGCVGQCLQSVTISKVTLNPTLTRAQVHWLPSGNAARDAEVRTALRDSTSQIRQQLNQRLLMSSVPPLDFLPDKSPAAGGQTAVDNLLERARLADKFQTLEESAARLAELYASPDPARAARQQQTAEDRTAAEQRRQSQDTAGCGLPANLSVYGLDREALVRKVAPAASGERGGGVRPLRFAESAACDLTADPSYPLRGLLDTGDGGDGGDGVNEGKG